MTPADNAQADISRIWSEPALQAYHDGELGAFARWRFERRLERSPELRQALVALATLGGLVRASEAPVASPDVWGALAPRLASVDAEKRGAAGAMRGPSALEALRAHFGALAAAGAAAAALAFALVTNETVSSRVGQLFGGVAHSGGVVHWMNGGQRNVMLLEGEGDVTVIWVLDPDSDRAAGGGSRGTV